MLSNFYNKVIDRTSTPQDAPAPYSMKRSPPNVCLLARNGLVNKVEFLGPIPNKIVKSLIFTYKHFSYSNKIFPLYLGVAQSVARLYQ